MSNSTLDKFAGEVRKEMTETRVDIRSQRDLVLDFMSQMMSFQDMVSNRFVSVESKLTEHDQKFEKISSVLDLHTSLLEDLNMEMKATHLTIEDQDTRISLVEAQT